jgi:hypothetical protein
VGTHDARTDPVQGHRAHRLRHRAGMHGIVFRDNARAIAELASLLG